MILKHAYTGQEKNKTRTGSILNTIFFTNKIMMQKSWYNVSSSNLTWNLHSNCGGYMEMQIGVSNLRLWSMFRKLLATHNCGSL